MSIATKKTAIATVLESVTGIGRVWKRERNPVSEAAFREAFIATDSRGRVLSGWEVHWLRREVEQVGAGQEDDFDTFRLRGYYAWEDDGEQQKGNSSTAWDTQLEAILTAFQGEQTLDATVTHCEPLDMTQNIYLEAFNVFCHYAEMELRTRTRRTGTSYS